MHSESQAVIGAGAPEEEKDGGKCEQWEKNWEKDEEFHRLEFRLEDSEEKERSGEVGRIRIGAALAHSKACWELESCPSSPGSKLRRNLTSTPKGTARKPARREAGLYL